jgi:hypothetical protein
MFFIQRMNGNNWVICDGPFGCEDTAYIRAKNFAGNINYPGPIRIVTARGAVVNIL